MRALSDAQKLRLKKIVVKGVKVISHPAIRHLAIICNANPHVQIHFYDEQPDRTLHETLINMYLYETLWGQ
jgi:hypothetical protein